MKVRVEVLLRDEFAIYREVLHGNIIEFKLTKKNWLTVPLYQITVCNYKWIE